MNAPFGRPPEGTARPASRPAGTGHRKTALAGLVGTAAAALLFVDIARDESGRTVEARVDGQAVILQHKAGPRYLRAYQDIVGVWTACDGIAYVPPGSSFTPEQCDAMLEEQLVKHARGVLACTPRLREPGREHQRAAAVSLAYNVGVAAWCRSTADRLFDAGDWRRGCDAFLMWNKAGGRVVRGLALRRERERALCLKGLTK